MVRFDFVVDKGLNVYLMEVTPNIYIIDCPCHTPLETTISIFINVSTLQVNMSPNLSSGHFPANRLLYEQVVFGMLGLVGVSSPTRSSIHKR